MQPQIALLDCTCMCTSPLIFLITTCHLRMASYDLFLLSLDHNPSAYSPVLVLVWRVVTPDYASPKLLQPARWLSRVDNKEGKGVSNARYGLCEFLESHARGIQVLTDQSARFKQPKVGVVSSTCYKPSVHRESSIELTKSASILHSPEKNRIRSAFAQLSVQGWKSRYFPNSYYTDHIARSTLSSLPYLTVHQLAELTATNTNS